MNQTYNIVHVVCTQRHAGVENYVGRLSGALTRRGHRVTVITRYPSTEFVPNGVTAIDVPNWRAAARALRELEDVDVVNSHLTEADAACALALRGRRTPMVSTRHFATRRWSADDGQGSAFLRLRSRSRSRRPGPLLSAIRQRISDRVDVELAVSDFVAAHIGRCDEVVLPGVEPPKNVVELSLRPKRAVILQRLEPSKSTSLALDAWNRSSARSRGWTLEIHGEGSQKSWLLSEVERLQLQDSVNLPGRCNDPEALLQSASLLLAPSVGEPLGLTVIEAMACGVPVIACASGGHLETVGRVEDSAMFPQDDSQRCAELIDQFTSDSNLRQIISKRQIELQRRTLSLETMAERIDHVYRSVIESKNSK